MTTLVIDDSAALRAALESALIPAEVQIASVRLDRDEDGRLLLEPSVAIGRGDRRRLRDAGVELRRGKLRTGAELSCWAEALPTHAGAEPRPPLGEILFVSEGDEGFLSISGELLRLGSEDQRLAFFEDEEGRQRNLCRVPDPPYYAVLRALDPDDPLRAFAPARPGGRVWVELGHAHPLAHRVEAEAGQLILIPASAPAARGRPGETRERQAEPSSWLRVPDGPWTDLHAVSEVTLPRSTSWTATEPGARLSVELRLVRAPTQRPADLWVLRERALEQIEELVRTVPDEVVAQLRFAIVSQADPLRGGSRTMVVLRARHSAKGPPALELDAETYAPVAQIPDLHLPVATTIDPPLRPAKLRELLVREPDKLIWLAPEEGDTKTEVAGSRRRNFVRESLAEAAFAPLSDWVDYLVGADGDILEPWIRSTIFDLDAFVSIGVEWSEGEAPRRERPSREDHERRRRRTRERPQPSEPAAELAVSEAQDQAPAEAPVVELTPVELPRSEIEERLDELERSFCELEAPLDDPIRVPMWAELGNLQAALYRSREAGLCWSRALWEPAPKPGPSHLELARRWVESEAGMLGYPRGADLLGITDVLAGDLDDQMVRALAAVVVLAEQLQRANEEARARAQVDMPELDGERLAELQRFFTAHGRLLDLRTLWLARSALARMTGDDRLALFQTRDLIMSTLREGAGLSRNIPAFIRSHGGEGPAGDLDRLGEELVRVRNEFSSTRRQRSLIESTHPEEPTIAYVRLVFAWGFARLGRSETATRELDGATELLGTRVDPERGDPIHRVAYLTYRARVQQALEGLPPSAPLSTDPGGAIAAREALEGFERYKYERLVQLTRILDPRQDIDPFRNYYRDDEPFEGAALLTRPDELAALFDRQLASAEELTAEARAAALGHLFEYLEALPEPLALPLLRRGVALIGEVPLDARAKLLRNAMLLAGYYDRSELVAAVLEVIDASVGSALLEIDPAGCAELLTRSAPILRRNNFAAELSSLLARLEQQLEPLDELPAVIARLHVAAGFAALGEPSRLQPALNAAYALLPELASAPGNYQILLRELAVALSRSTAGQAIAGARSLMERLATTTDTMSTNSHFCVSVIQLMEAVVLSLASEDLALSDWARRWLEEDEHLLHRRIHRDLAAGRG